MTEMLQKNKNVAKNVANKNSQDLTEQWKKGELPEGLYYVENNEGNIGILGWAKFAGWYNVKQVLAPVPSYDEWQAKSEENAELKELLKECQNMIAFKHEVYEEDALIKEIDEALR